MSRLTQTQRAFRKALLSGTPPESLLADASGTATVRFDIYASAYRARMLNALRDNYPVLRAALGDEDFDTLGEAYLAANPSTRPSIRWFGDGMHGFIVGGGAQLPHPALADLAQMEWALRGAFDAADAPAATLAEVGSIAPADWPELRFALHPSVAILALDWAVEPIWHTLTDDPDAPTDAPVAHTHPLLIWRQRLDTRFRSLERSEHRLLLKLGDGGTFGDACAQIADDHGGGDVTVLVTRALAQFIADGVLVWASGLPLNAVASS